MKKANKILVAFVIVFAICALLTLTACDETGNDKIKLSATTLTLSEGGAKGNLIATLNGIEGKAEWSVDNKDIVSLQAAGTVCAVTPLKEGTATVTVTVDKYSAKCTVTVTKKVDLETVVITLDGNAITTLTLKMGEEKTLAAVASKGSAVTWKSTDENVVTVNDGKVTAVRPGNAKVIAQVSNLVKAELSVTVEKNEGSDYYDLKCAAEGGTTTLDDPNVKLNNDEFFYWLARSAWGQQQVEVEYAYFENNAIHFAYTCDTDTGYSYGFQLMYKHSQHTIGNYYKLSCKINVDQDCTVSLNGNDIDLKKGDNNVTVYYCYTDSLGSGTTYGISSFDLVMGYDNGTQTGLFVQNAKVVVSDIAWEEDTARVTLAAPSFTLDENNVITITDTNTEGVGSYLLKVFDGENLVTSVEVENGKTVDTSTIGKGTYTVRLVAVAGSAHYIDSAVSETSATMTVTTAASYEMASSGENGAKAAPGTWTYWTESWVQVSEHTCNDNVVTLTFSNNSGNWYDTQLFYKSTSNQEGKLYKMTFTVQSSGSGRVTVSGNVITLQEGTHNYEVTVREGAGASFVLVMGVNPENNKQEIQEGTIVVSNLKYEEQAEEPVTGDFVEGEEKDALANAGKWIYWAAKTEWNLGGVVTVSKAETIEKGITLEYTSTGNCWFGMQLFYKDATLVAGKTYKLTMKINASAAGDITINGQKVTLVEGENNVEVTYTEAADKASVSIQFGANGTILAGGTFSVTDVAFEESTPTTPEETNAITNGGEGDATAKPGQWIYWNDQKYCGSMVTVSEAKLDNGTITLAYNTSEGHCWFGMQLFYKDATHAEGKSYKLTMKINSSVAGDITVNGQKVTLVEGENNVEVTYTEPAGKASISIQFGVADDNTMIAAGTFVLSDIVTAEVA